MKRLILLLWIVGLCGSAAQGEKDRKVYYIQVILATNQEKEEKDWKRIGPKLKKELSPIFQWKHYWEVSRQEVEVEAGKPSRVRLAERRELELEVLKKEDRLVLRLFREGRLTRKMKDSVSKRRIIMGGDSSKDEGWFVVVRRDRPAPK